MNGVTRPQITGRRQLAGHKFHAMQQAAGERYQVPDLILDVFEKQEPQPGGLRGAQYSFADVAVKHTGDFCDTKR